jgi:phosphate ABC transporter permease protein PstC
VITIRSRTFASPRFADPAFRWLLTILAGLILAIIAFFFAFLIEKARPALAHQGIVDFVFMNDWNPGLEVFGAWPMVLGTLITAATALVIGVPIAVMTAIFIVEFAPLRLAGPVTILVELLAAVPSVVYGLWGFFVVIPELMPVQQWLSDTFAFLPFVGGTVAGPSYFIAGLILAIMILPIVCAISREVIQTVPAEHKEAALALGATRWEMIKVAVLPYSRPGIVGASMLGLGRAVGETIAVVLVIGNSPIVGESLFSHGYTLAAVIASEFGEATPLHSGALIACGLLLFVITLLINGAARTLVVRTENRRFRDLEPVAEPNEPLAVGAVS